MEMVDLIAPQGVIAQLRATSKRQVLQELARRAGALTGLDERAIFERLIERERLATTGIGMGVAVPHGKLGPLGAPHALFARLERPIPFEAVDDEPVYLIVVLLTPEDAGADHLTALALVSRRLRDRAFCDKLRGTDSAEALYALLTDATAASEA